MRKCKAKVRAGWDDFVDGKFVSKKYDWNEKDYCWLRKELEVLAGFIIILEIMED